MELKRIVDQLNILKTPGFYHNSNEIFIGGSYALKYYYQLLDREPRDIDVIIYEFNEKQFNWLKEHFDIINNDSRDAYKELSPENECNIFYIQAFLNGQPKIINFITYKSRRYYYENCYDTMLGTIKDIPVLSLKAIIDAKLEYGRDKDNSDILQIIKNIMTPTKKHLSQSLNNQFEI